MNHPRPLDVICIGEALVDLLPGTIGPLESVPSFARHAGGALANVAVGVARLGGRVAFVGTVGDDPFGRFLQQFLSDEGVEVSGVHRIAGTRTGVAFVALNESGQPRFFAAGRGGADLALSDEQLQPAPIEQSAYVCLGTYVLSGASVREPVLRALARARAAGTRVALDPNLRLHQWEDPEELRVLLPQLIASSDVVKLSSEECEFVTGASDIETALQRIIEAGPMLAIATMGAQGCRYALRTSSGTRAGAVATRAVTMRDSTGAGDGFMAALVVALARLQQAGHSIPTLAPSELEAILCVANEAGGRVCEQVGATVGLPRADELDAVMVRGVRLV